MKIRKPILYGRRKRPVTQSAELRHLLTKHKKTELSDRRAEAPSAELSDN